MAISLRMSDEEERVLREYAKMKAMTVSEVLREAVLEKIEDEIDLVSYDEAMKALTEDGETLTLQEVRDIVDG